MLDKLFEKEEETHPNSKINQRYCKKGKLWSNISPECKHKNLLKYYQIQKQYKKNHILQVYPERGLSRNAS